MARKPELFHRHRVIHGSFEFLTFMNNLGYVRISPGSFSDKSSQATKIEARGYDEPRG